MEVARDADTAMLESSRELLEQSLTDLTGRADKMTGQAVIDPAPTEQSAGC